MADLSRPATYIDKLLYGQRVVKAAQYRHDPKQAIRELCEGMAEVIAALVDREHGREVKLDAGQPEQKPGPPSQGQQ